MKIYLGDEYGNYELKKDEYGIPYINSEEIIESFKYDFREDEFFALCIELFKAAQEIQSENEDNNDIEVTNVMLDYWIERNENPIITSIAKAFKEILKTLTENNTY